MNKLILTLIGLVALTTSAFTQDLVYKPKNPAFGGDTFNYQWMLSSAEAQNDIEDPKAKSSSSYSRDPLADFESNLKRQILYQLSRQLVSDQFGEDSLEEGSYEVGSYKIEIAEGSDGLNVQILDSQTGSQTNVVIPYY
ncbi:curli production assembly/transport component CsgF [Marinilabiliaceae bacterium JC017]|nr:curli production assembly/transport component CsgF [Marinilabiliaceae bacterium JC017]